jgi:hypothetical protein
LGFYMPEWFVRLKGQVNHEHKVQQAFKKHTGQLQNTIKNTKDNCITLSRTHKTNNNNFRNHTRYFKYQRRLILTVVGRSSYETNELILFILGVRLVIVVDSFIFLTFASSET